MVRFFSIVVALCIVGPFAVQSNQSKSGPYAQQCGKPRTIWTNPDSQAVTKTLRLTDKCHEPEDMGTISVFDQNGKQIRQFTFSKGFTVTVPVEVPAKGHIDYVCLPSALEGETTCESEVLP